MALNKITVDSIASNTITASVIADGTVIAADIADGSITGPKLAATSISGNNLTANCISGNNIVYNASLSGNVTVTGSIKPKTYQETFSNVSISGGAVTYDLGTSSLFRTILTGDVVVTFSNPPSQNTALSFAVQIVGNGSSNTVTWPSNVKYKDNTAPTIVTTSNINNTFAFYTWDGGATYVGTAIVNQYS